MRFALLFTAVCFSALNFSGAGWARDMESYPTVKLQSLDKITARTMTFEAKVGNTIKFGSLYIKVQACRKAPPIEQPESAAFLQIWEVKSPGGEEGDIGKKDMPKGEAQWIFSGWMFASSPALSHMDHAVYDVWVLDCLGTQEGGAPEKKEEGAAPASTPEEAIGSETKPPAEPANAAPAEGETPAGESAETTPAESAPANDTPVESEELSPLGD